MAKWANHGSRRHKYPLKSSTNGSTVVQGFTCSDAEPRHFFLYVVNTYVRIIVERHADIGMTHYVLQCFGIHPGVSHTRAERMPE